MTYVSPMPMLKTARLLELGMDLTKEIFHRDRLPLMQAKPTVAGSLHTATFRVNTKGYDETTYRDVAHETGASRDRAFARLGLRLLARCLCTAVGVLAVTVEIENEPSIVETAARKRT